MKNNLDKIFIAILSACLALICYIKLTNKQQSYNELNNSFGCNTEDIANMYIDYINKWKQDVSLAFDKAEAEIYNVKPEPNPDVIGVNEDPKKCICKGSGVIIQGDGHTTVCPYHGNKSSRKEIIIKQFNTLEK